MASEMNPEQEDIDWENDPEFERWCREETLEQEQQHKRSYRDDFSDQPRFEHEGGNDFCDYVRKDYADEMREENDEMEEELMLERHNRPRHPPRGRGRRFIRPPRQTRPRRSDNRDGFQPNYDGDETVPIESGRDPAAAEGQEKLESTNVTAVSASTTEERDATTD